MDEKKRKANLAASLVLVDQELCALGAKACRLMVEALMAEGFTKEEAIDFVAEQGLSLVGIK